MPDIALFCPDQAGNVGTIIRTAACFDMGVHIIHPCGFAFSEKAFRRSAMDYADAVTLYEHDDFESFQKQTEGRRLILMTTKGTDIYSDFSFKQTDIIIFGRESAGAPEYVHRAADAELLIPVKKELRSLNIAVSAGIAMAEAVKRL